MLATGNAKDFAEAKEIITKGPIIEGFENSQDIKISSRQVKDFIFETFGEEAIKKAKISRIVKNNRYLVFFKNDYGSDFSEKDKDHYQKIKNLMANGLLRYFSANIAMANDKESYLKAESVLENKNDLDKLDHIYRVRAGTGDFNKYSKISLESFDIEKSNQFDYLEKSGLDKEEEKMQAYMLGAIAHEIAHRCEKRADPKLLAEYEKIIKEESAPTRKKYVTDYVLKHKEAYNSDDKTLLKEDFAEAVRIYAINPAYLSDNYPRRTDFLRKNFPFIIPNKAIEIVKQNF